MNFFFARGVVLEMTAKQRVVTCGFMINGSYKLKWMRLTITFMNKLHSFSSKNDVLHKVSKWLLLILFLGEKWNKIWRFWQIAQKSATSFRKRKAYQNRFGSFWDNEDTPLSHPRPLFRCSTVRCTTDLFWNIGTLVRLEL